MAIKVHGLAVPWDVPRKDGKYQFSRGAFDESITRGRVNARLNHTNPVAAQQWQSLLFFELPSDHQPGLYFQMTIHDRDDADLIIAAADAGQLNGCSPGLINLDKARRYRLGALLVYEKVDLLEVSLCLYDSKPAFPKTWARIKERDDEWI